ncbi:MAG: PCRF domain-containing protein, partial [Spirochaetes bacterium]|nr:PCRF domain-containing protein [Spirochaetota bacterium]
MLQPSLIAKVEELAERFTEIENLISDPDVLKDPKRYKELMQEHSHLSEIMSAYSEYKSLMDQLSDAQQVSEDESDPEMHEMAEQEAEELEEKLKSLGQRIRLLLVPKDPLDGKDIIMEIRAGTGGDEASLFAADLFRMYSRYAERHKWKIEVLNSSPTEVGGFKEITFSISGKEVFGNLKYE